MLPVVVTNWFRFFAHTARIDPGVLSTLFDHHGGFGIVKRSIAGTLPDGNLSINR
jgi:hypothetical protein